MKKIGLSVILLLCICFHVSHAGTEPSKINQLFSQFGKSAVQNALLSKSRNNTVTIQVNNKLYLKNGMQSVRFITVHSVLYDLKRLNMNFTILQRETVKIHDAQAKNKSLDQKLLAAKAKRDIYLQNAPVETTKTKKETGSGVILQRAKITCQRVKGSLPHVKFTLSPKWRNYSSSDEQIEYIVYFYNYSGTVIGSVRNNYCKIISNATMTAPQEIRSYYEDTEGKFNFNDMKYASIEYKVSGQEGKKMFQHIKIENKY